MIRFLAPGFLLAGGLLALVPIVLHMLAPSPPERRPLPTARFLAVDRRTRLALRRPADLPLLALRVLLLLLLGAAFARPEWLPRREGSAVIVLLDAGADMAPAWAEAVAAAEERLREAGGVVVVFDTTARVLGPFDDALLDSLRSAPPSAATASYLAALRGLRRAAGALPAETARAVLLTRARWGAWSPAVPMARAAAWPGRIEVVEVGRDGGRGSPGGGADLGTRPAGAVEAPATVAVAPGDASATIRVEGPPDHPLRPYVTAALAALGYRLEAGGSRVAVRLGGEGSIGVRVEESGADVAAWQGEGGSSGEAVGARGAGRSPDRPSGPGRLVLAGAHALPGWIPLPGRPASGARVLAVWEDGRPAAAVVRDDNACAALLAAEPETPSVAADPAFPHLLAALLEGCGAGTAPAVGGTEDAALSGAPLDEGARRLLAGASLPPVAELASLEARRGRSLVRVAFGLALLVAALEAIMAYRRRVRTRAA